MTTLLYLSFLAHPTATTQSAGKRCGGIQHRDLVAFYHQYYHPGNAVLAV
jgi:hypothetical protein